MAENPESHGAAEKIVNKALEDYEEQKHIPGFTLAARITYDLNEAGCLREGTSMFNTPATL